MKKFITIVAAVAVLFSAMSCTTSMHDGTNMLVEKVVVEGLTDLAGQEILMAGNWIPNTAGDGFWKGTKADAAPEALATVDADGIATFTGSWLVVEATLSFKVMESAGSWDSTFTGGDNIEVANTFTGPSIPKTLNGKKVGDGKFTWEF